MITPLRIQVRRRERVSDMDPDSGGSKATSHERSLGPKSWRCLYALDTRSAETHRWNRDSVTSRAVLTDLRSGQLQ
jgi:hypothetical protein